MTGVQTCALPDLLPEKVLNIHPSLLPLYRGPSPIQYQIMNNDSRVGTSIMVIDKEIDHGPIIAQAEITLERKDGQITEDYNAVEKSTQKSSCLSKK